MLSKTVPSFPPSTQQTSPAEPEQGRRALSLRDLGDLLRFARLRVLEERLPQVAGSLTFTTTLALVPLLTIALAVFTSFPMFADLRAAIDAYFRQIMLPRAISETIIANLTLFARQATGLSALGGATLVLTSIAMLGMIERVFNRIWRVRSARPPVQRLVIYWAVITLGPVMFTLSMTATTQLYSATGALAQVAPLLSTVFYTLVSVGLSTLAFTLLYMGVPNRLVDWRDAACGALVAALAFEVAKRGFGIFIRQFPSYAIIYGALAALPVLLLWMYVSWMITLVGALLAAALPVIRHERWWHQPAPGGAFVDAMAVLAILHGAAQEQSSLVTSSQIRARTRIGYEELRMLLEQMVGEGWVGRVDAGAAAVSTSWGSKHWARRMREGEQGWVLLANPARLRIADVYRLFVFGGAAGVPGSAPALAREVEAAMEATLGQSLAEHFALGYLAGAGSSSGTSASDKAASTASGCSAII